jgi:hypothetical protein
MARNTEETEGDMSFIVNAGERKKEAEAHGFDVETGETTRKVMDNLRANYTVAVVGLSRRTSAKGTNMLGIRFVCVDARDRVSGDVLKDQIGRVLDREYAITESAIGFLSDLIVACGYDGNYDPMDNERLNDIFAGAPSGLVRFRLKEREYTKKDGSKGKAFEPSTYFKFPTGVDTPDGADELINVAIDDFNKYLENLEKNPRRSAGGGGASGGGGGSVDDNSDLPF